MSSEGNAIDFGDSILEGDDSWHHLQHYKICMEDQFSCYKLNVIDYVEIGTTWKCT